MADIRALERGDIPIVVGLLRAHMGGWELNEKILAATTLEHPWSHPDVPSLVALDATGDVVGFIAAQVRKMRLDDREILGVCCGDLIVSPEHRVGAPGAQLLSRMLSGPQDVTWSDSASNSVVGAWRAKGGDVDYSRAADFMFLLRPVKWVRNILAAGIRRERIGRSMVPVGAIPADAGGRLLSPRGDGERAGEVDSAEVTAAEIVQQLPPLPNGVRVGVAWDEPALTQTLTQIQAVHEGLTCRIVRRGLKPIGWYAYVARPGRVSRLLHLAASTRAVDAVLGDLVNHATEIGSVALAGRAEPHLEWSLRTRRAVLQFAWQPVIKARDPEIGAALASSRSLLSRLDGEISPV